MSPQEYKQHLKALFSTISPLEPEEEKLRKIEQFRRMRGVKQHLPSF